MIVTLEALKKFGLKPEDTRVVIQGFGNVGGMAARLMAARGFQIISIVEYNGAVYNRHGLDIEALMLHRKETGTIIGFAGGEDIDRREAMFLRCDVLMPAATENVITSENAANLRCRILCEGANGPTTAIADEILAEKKIFVIPDILANAGGVTVSYFEWVQDRQGFFWNEELVNSRLEEIMVGSFEAVTSVRRQAPGGQPHRGLHAGAGPCSHGHAAARSLRLTAGTPPGSAGFQQTGQQSFVLAGDHFPVIAFTHSLDGARAVHVPFRLVIASTSRMRSARSSGCCKAARHRRHFAVFGVVQIEHQTAAPHGFDQRRMRAAHFGGVNIRETPGAQFLIAEPIDGARDHDAGVRGVAHLADVFTRHRARRRSAPVSCRSHLSRTPGAPPAPRFSGSMRLT